MSRGAVDGSLEIVAFTPGDLAGAPNGDAEYISLAALALDAEPDDASQTDCAIVVVTYNSERHIISFLDSIVEAAGNLSWQVVVVDNASSDRTVELVRDHPSAVCLALTTNHGYSAGINAGRRHARPYSTLLVANPDVRLAPGSIEQLHRAVTHNGHGAAVPLLTDASGRTVRSLRREPSVGRQLGESLLGDHLPGRPGWLSEIVREREAYDRGEVVDWATGAVVMVSANCDAQVGAWDESYFLFSEEVDYAARIRDAGFTVAFVPEASAAHDEGGSGRATSMLGLVAVNRLRYFRRRHGRVASSFYALALLVGLLLRGADRQHRIAARRLMTAAVPGIIWSRFAPGLRPHGQIP